MTKILLTLLVTVLLCGVSASAQSYRLTDLSNRLSTQSEDLAERAYNNYTARSNNNRTDLDNMMLAQQLTASANAFRRMVQDRRRTSELRDAAALLMDLSRRFPNFGDINYYWRDSQRTIDEINRELQTGGGNNTENPPVNRDTLGQVRWRGMVDDEVQLNVKDSTIDARTISGSTLPSGTYNFTSPLPDSRRITVGVNKIKGRGNVRVIQQPTKDNDYTAVIQIKDNGNGAKEYDLEIYWTR